MGAMAVPLPASNLEAWESWVGEITGPRKAEFDEMNARHGVTDHRAYLQGAPDGSYVVIAVTDGPGGDGFIASVAASDHEFDKWFLQKVGEAHGVDPAGPMPSGAERRI